MTTADDAKLPFKKIDVDDIESEFEGMRYKVKAAIGSFSKPNNGSVFRLTPKANAITLNLSQKD